MISSLPFLAGLLWLGQTEAGQEQKQVILSFEYVDGKFVPVVKHDGNSPIDANSSSDGVPASAIAAVFLLLLITVAFVGSALLIGTISSSFTLRRLPFNILLLNLGVVCLVECVLNVVWSAVYLVTQPWRFGYWVCYINSFLMEFVPLIYSLLLLTLVIDRAVALKEPSRYKRNVSVTRQRCYLVLYWLLSLVAVSPVAVGLVKSWPFPDRYSCQVMHELSMYYGLFTGGLGYIALWIGMLGALLVIHRLVAAEKKRERKAQRGREQTNKLVEPSLFMFAMHQNVHLWNEMRNVGLVSALFVAYLALMAPYLIRVKVDQIVQGYDYNYYRNLTLARIEDFSDSDTVGNSTVTTTTTTTTSSPIPTTNVANNDTNNGNGTTYHERDFLLVPEVIEPHLGAVDTVFVWLRYLHAAIVPILIFAIHKDLRKKAEDLLCCWRPNSVENRKSSERPISAYVQQKQREWEKNQKKFKKVTNFSVPVLFASSEGLFLRLVDDNFGGFEQHKDVLDESIKAQWTVDPKFVTELCDLQLPMSAIRGRTPANHNSNSNNNSAPEEQFGTTVTVVVGNKQTNLKSSLRRPKPEPQPQPPVASSPEEDEGFIEGNGSGHKERVQPIMLQDMSSPEKPQRKVQFQPQVEEIPRTDTRMSSSTNTTSTNSNPSTNSSFLPPIMAQSPSPNKKKQTKPDKTHLDPNFPSSPRQKRQSSRASSNRRSNRSSPERGPSSHSRREEAAKSPDRGRVKANNSRRGRNNS